MAIITGGDGTIGLATAKLFLTEGAKVLLVGHREDALRTAARGSDPQRVAVSVADVMGLEGIGAYTASKHAEGELMRVAALEGAKLGIRVNTINPSMVEGPMMRSLEDGVAPGHSDVVKDAMLARNPMGRYATPEEVARLALSLASGESSFVTSSVYKIDGGFAF